jgi:hypothetical protein
LINGFLPETFDQKKENNICNEVKIYQCDAFCSTLSYVINNRSRASSKNICLIPQENARLGVSAAGVISPSSSALRFALSGGSFFLAVSV